MHTKSFVSFAGNCFSLLIILLAWAPREVGEQRHRRGQQVKVSHRSLKNVVIASFSLIEILLDYDFKIIKVELGRQLGEAQGGGGPD